MIPSDDRRPSGHHAPSATPWPGLSAHDTLTVPVCGPDWALPCGERIVDGLVFVPKAELHITLAGRDAIAAIRARHGGPGAETLLRSAFAACDWRYRRTRRFLRLRRPQPPGPDAGSIIELLELPGLATFYRALADTGTPRPVPPAHVTLWTHARPQGIGVADSDALAALCVREVSLDELGLTRI
ncbi:hypothetical protein [Luteimonas deserti]|uniref:Uncharacterized protein n=1 Tax=Luteimonas deserti TaxID=2752306 RepID=A0A7Z0TYS6_9GAMM|nr:hypothetical protein [Luteimonas deserti]NYZ61463.1 hypothetical protein [Luteimonas deserti]